MALGTGNNNAQEPRRCPVRLFLKFKEKRPPPTMLHDDAPFFLAVDYRAKKFDTHACYKSAPLGKNKLGVLLRDMAKEGNLKGRFTNHSVRKTGITNLIHAGVPPNLVTQMSGHKNVNSLKNYATVSAKQQKAMSDILANPGKIISPITNYQPFANNSYPLETVSVQISENNAKTGTNTIHKSCAATMMNGLFSGASLSGCTFNFNFSTNQN